MASEENNYSNKQDGIKLCIPFAHKVNKLCFCGPKDSYNMFQQYMLDQSNKDEVRDAIQKFEGLAPYLNTISKKHDKDFLDPKVVEAYWIGNELLDSFSFKEIKSIIPQLAKRGFVASKAIELYKQMPRGYVPHHNFHVMYIGGGPTFGKLPTTLNFMENCRVSWGQVKEVNKDYLIVNTNKLVDENDQLQLAIENNKRVSYISEFFQPKIDDIVALHWSVATTILTPKQAFNLEKYTNIILEVRNRSWKQVK